MSHSPPFQITPKILSLVAEIQEIAGLLKSYSAEKPSIKLRKANKIRTVHSSLAIEGNTLTLGQITDIIENKKVIGPQLQILEVKNAIDLYDHMRDFEPTHEKDLLKAHRQLTQGLVRQAGEYRKTQVGIFKGSQVSHVAPPAKRVPELMTNLFKFLKKKDVPWLVKGCVFHYELEFIHPFEDGNGRMGRLWQQLLLMKQSPVFEFISPETIIHSRQKEYYKVLKSCDRAGDSTLFIEFSLAVILESLKKFLKDYQPTRQKGEDRVMKAIENFGQKHFSRKDYMTLIKGISTATASRDLAKAVLENRLIKSGQKNLAVYKVKSKK